MSMPKNKPVQKVEVRKIPLFDFKAKSVEITIELVKLAKHFSKYGNGIHVMTPGSSVALENLVLQAARMHDAMTGAKAPPRKQWNGSPVGAEGRLERAVREALGYTFA